MKLQDELSHGVLSKVGEDEPLFILRAKDKLAPEIVHRWIFQAAIAGVPEEKILEAYRCCAAMLDWQAKHGSKMPD